MFRRFTIIALALLIAPAARVLAADPTGEQVLDRYLEVTGGKAKYEAVKSRVVTMQMDMPAQGMKAAMTIEQLSPNFYHFSMEMPQMGTMERGSDGTTAWEKSAMMGTRIIEGDEKDQISRESMMNAELKWRDLYAKAENAGVEEVDGKKCYKVKLTAKSADATKPGREEIRFYEVDSGLLSKAMLTVESQMGQLEVSSKFEDYRDVEGMKMPFKTTQEVPSVGQTMVMTVQDVKLNTEIPAAKFELPEDVKKLRDKPATTQPSGK